MPKNLNNVLQGVRKSTTSKLTTGKNPGVDYADKMKYTRDFLDQHSVEKHEDRVGNGDDVYKASNVKKAVMQRHGHEPKPKDIRVYDKTNQITNEEVEQLEEADLMHIKVGEKVRLTNPKASPKHTVDKIKGDKVHITKDDGSKVVMPLNRIKRVKAQAMKLKEAKDDREYGYEGDMAITQLKTICRHAEHLMKMLKPDTDLPEWVQSKITKAEDYISTAHDYLMSEMNEEVENLIELKKTTLDSYNHKSFEDYWDAYHKAKKEFSDDHTSVKVDDESDKVMKKREKGFTLARKKLGIPGYFGAKVMAKEETELSESKCNMSEAGTMCEVHGKKACPTEDDENAGNKEPRFTGKRDKEGKVVLITDKKQIQEKLTKKMSVGDIIKDVKNSEDPRFEGDSQEKRKERALAIWYKMHPEKSNKVEEGFLDQRSKKSTRTEEASKKMAADISKKKEKIFDSDLRKQEILFTHKLKNGKGKIKEQSAPADTSISFPATNSREGLKV